MTRPIIPPARAVCLLMLALCLCPPGCGRPPVNHGGEASSKSGRNKETPAEADRIAVRVEALRRGPISYKLKTTGDLQAEEWTDLVVRRAGIVETLHVEEGKMVRAGSPLLALDQREILVLLDQARTAETEAKQRAELADNAAAESENSIEQARIAASKAETEYKRYNRLSRGVVQQEELENRAYEMRRTKLALDAAINGRQQARINGAIAKTVAFNAGLKRKKAEIDLDFTVLKAPFAGVISARHVQRGQFLAANVKAFTLVDCNNLKLEVNLPQRYLLRLTSGLKIVLETEAFPDHAFKAVLERVSPVVGEKGTIKVTIRLQQKELRLRPGMYVSASIILDTHENALLASKRGVQYSTLGGTPVVFIERDGKAVKLPVKIGYREPSTVEVIPLPALADVGSVASDFGIFGTVFYRPPRFVRLREGDRLIVAGQDKLNGGEEVNVVAVTPAPTAAADREVTPPAKREKPAAKARPKQPRQP